MMTKLSTVEIDLVGATKQEGVHARLAAGFGFPDYYGKNWDAFWDCITTLDPMPQKIRIKGMKHMFSALPRDAAIFMKSMEDFRSIPEAQTVDLIIE